MRKFRIKSPTRKHNRITLVRVVLAAAAFCVYCAVFAGVSAWLSGVFKAHPGPAFLRLAASFSASAAAVLAATAVLTFVFGRFFCSFLCPFGLFQDAVSVLRAGKRGPGSDYAVLRYAVLGAVLGASVCGSAAGFLLVEPYSNFGRMAAFSSGAVVVFVLITAAAVWKKRLFCVSLCPVGTVLGCISRHSLFRMRIAGNCVKCGICAMKCPTGCIDAVTGTVDGERCILCMQCIDVCRTGALKYVPSFSREGMEPHPDQSRRRFIIKGAAVAAGAAAGAVIAKTAGGILGGRTSVTGVLPPGAGSIGRFASKCTSCQLCTVNCPSGIIVPARFGIGPVSVDLSKGSCLFSCNTCSRVCPTGAIRLLELEEKQRLRIASAVFNAGACIAFQEFQEGTRCGLCAKACPTGAFSLRSNGTPVFRKDRCIGCGACAAACAAKPRKFISGGVEVNAVVMEEIPEQTFAARESAPGV